MNLNTMRAALLGLSAYRPLLHEPVMVHLRQFLNCIVSRQGECALDAYAEIFSALRQEGHFGLGDFLWDRLRYQESSYARLVERGGSDPALENCARREIENLARLARTDCDKYIQAMKDLLPGEEYAPVLANLPRWSASAPFDFDTVTAFYQQNGAGFFGRYRTFLWEGEALVPVEDPDCPRPEELLGYEHQRNQVIANTRPMLEGKQVNNVLLFGDSGTGKSATVKSMLYIPGFEALRLIEVQKNCLHGLPQLIRSLAGRKQKFILFIDDLAFDQDDMNYSVLKTILEGGLEPRPDNVAIYATSNRRNLVRQTFSDRAGDEVDRDETIQEKTALADRFGLRVVYQGFTKKEYLELIARLAEQKNITIPWETVEAKAVAWDARHPGRSPRTARQFIDSL